MDFTLSINTVLTVASLLIGIGAFAQKFRSHEILDAERFKNIDNSLCEIKDDLREIKNRRY